MFDATAFWKVHRLTPHMIKRLAQLASPSGTHEHGTPMSALKFRDLAEDGPSHKETYGDHGFTRTVWHPCCQITEAGREALAEARRQGW